jgi:RNA polymerase sigma-70 factor (family 1)
MNQPLPIVPFRASENFPGIYRNTETQTDYLMMRVLHENDYHAFEQLFKNMYAPLCRFCTQFVLVKEVAEELVSDVFYTIWKKRAQLIVTSPKAYLFAAVRNRGYDYRRKVKRSAWCDLREATDTPANEIGGQDILIQQEMNDQLEKSVAKLPKQCRLIFELSRDQGLKYREIATSLNLSIKTVETQMGRALKQLRQSLVRGEARGER